MSVRVALVVPAWNYDWLADRKPKPWRSPFRRDVSGQGVLPFLGLQRLATQLADRGHAVWVSEGYGLTLEDQLRSLRAWQPDVLGLSVATPLWQQTTRLVRAVRKEIPHLRIAVGGPHAELRGRELMLECPDIHAVFTTQDQASFVEDWVVNPSGIEGRSRWEAGPQEPPTEATAAGPRVAARIHWREYLPNIMFLDRRPFATSFTSTGCPHRCAFCSVPSYPCAVRYRSNDELLDEMTFMDRALGIRTLSFVDDETIFVAPQYEGESLLGTLQRRNLDLRWGIYLNRFDLGSRRLQQLQQAGCSRIYVLAESGTQRHLHRVKNSPVTVEQIQAQIERISAQGMEVCARFQLGLPGETVSEAEETIRFASSLPLDLASFVRPLVFPGSKMAAEMDLLAREGDRRSSYYGSWYRPNAMTTEQQSHLLGKAVRLFYGGRRATRLMRGGLRRTWELFRRGVIDGVD